MKSSDIALGNSLTSSIDAPQHAPRPLPLFLRLAGLETGGDPLRMAAVLRGLAVYQQAQRKPPPTPSPRVAGQVGRARLLDFGGRGPAVVVVPSLINDAAILDLDDDRSLLRWLARQHVRPLLVDWGTPESAERDLDIGGHVENLLLPLIDGLGEPCHLVGYCLGGTMALAAAVHRPPLSLALVATPWRFDGFPDPARTAMAQLWRDTRPLAETLGLMPAEVLQGAFWMLDPRRTVAKYERLGSIPMSARLHEDFVAIEDWANGGPPLTLAAARELATTLFTHDCTGRGEWRVGGTAVIPERLACPMIDIVSATDRIVPQRSAAGVGKLVTLESGHVGMVVGGRRRMQLWPTLARWLSSAGTG